MLWKPISSRQTKGQMERRILYSSTLPKGETIKIHQQVNFTHCTCFCCCHSPKVCVQGNVEYRCNVKLCINFFTSAPQSSQPSLQFNQESNASRPTSAQSTSGQSQPTTSARSNQTPLTTTAATNLTTTSNVNRSTSTAQSASSTSTHAGPSTEPTTSQAGAISESSRSRFDPLGINFEKPKYPAYAVLTVRINTYNGWPDYLDQSPRDMALAGFFYAGKVT